MISKDKQYRTRDGRKVRIYATDGKAGVEVQGAVLNPEGWTMLCRNKAGRQMLYPECPSDLIEVKQRIKRTIWVNVYPENWGDIFYKSKKMADFDCKNRFACVKVEIDCEEGEGL